MSNRCITAGVAAITAAALTFIPSVRQPTPEPARSHASTRSVLLAADVRTSPLWPTIGTASSISAASPAQAAAPVIASSDLPNLLVDWIQRLVIPTSASQAFPTPEFPPAVVGTSIGSVIKNTYNAVEPWVQWGFEVATYAVGWVPYVGWLAPQIMIFYNFGERIVRSITFNVADWLDGTVSFGQGLVNVGVDTVNSFIQLGIDEWNFWLPPLPPIPPFPATATATTTQIDVPAPPVDKTAAVQQDSNIGANKVSVDVATTKPSPATTDTTATQSEPTAHSQQTVVGAATTSRSGNVQAQGEVRGTGTDSTDEQTTGDAQNRKAQNVKPAAEPTKPGAADPSTTDASTGKDGQDRVTVHEHDATAGPQAATHPTRSGAGARTP